MPEQAISRAEILFQQRRYEDAEPILQDLLANYPDYIKVRGLLTEVKLATGQAAAAHALVDTGLSNWPDYSHLYYHKARAYMLEGKMKEAVEFLQEAIQLDPEDADYYALLGDVQLQRKKFEEALQMADHSLALDPSNLLALNTRTTVLQKLNRKEEAFQTIEGALREDPNNSYTHSNYGWNLLETREYKKAREHFREALRHDPDNHYAQQGMVQAIKATNPVYRIFLQYSFWMTNLTSKYQWGVILGFYFGVRALRVMADQVEAMRPFLTPLIVLLMIFAFSTWVVTPLSNLLFWLHPYGKYMLKRKEKLSSGFVGISLLMSIAGWVLYATTGNEAWITLGVVGLTLMVPLSMMFAVSRYKYVLLIAPLAMLLVGIFGLVSALQTGELFNMFSIVYILAFMAYQWGVNFLVIREDNYA